MKPNDNLDPRPSDDDATRPTLGDALTTALVGLAIGGIVLAGGSVLFSSMHRELDVSEPVATAPAPAPVAVASPDDSARALLEAQDRVASLEAQLAVKQSKLDKVAAAAGLDPADAAQQDLAQEVATLRANLLAARGFRDHLRTELRTALATVDQQAADLEVARVQVGSWKRTSERAQAEKFAAVAKTELCDHGTRRGVEKCQAAVDAYFTDARLDRFASCVDAGAAAPVLLTDAKAVPARAEPLPTEGSGRRENAYVLYCDPTLPEQVASSDVGPE